MTITQSPPETAELPLDEAAAEAFAGRLIEVLNSASLAVLTSIGHQTGLFDTLSTLPSSTSQQIADAAGLNERYVREWLGGVTTADVVRYDPATSTYWLPREHAAFLTSAAGPDNLARVMQYVAMMGEVEQQIIGCFRNGGGLPYSAYPRFHEVMAEESAGVYDAALVDVIVPLVPGLTERLTSGIEAADVGCGRGHAINVLATAFPASRFTGFDFSEEAIGEARSEAQHLCLGNAQFEVCDVATLRALDRFHLVTAFDAIHDQAHPGVVLANIARSLRPGGVFLMQDIKASSKVEENIELPWATMLYAVSTLHCMS
ncbi:MAG: class I SAM-dependent methyltransferase, partial [Propionibacteriaceae bacterium]|nr:class I SAM-dependent methyltransferase [Propionibacteriaceae bacterium]